MKNRYEKPMIEFEDFELNSAIAAGCSNIISLGPGDPVTGVVCKEYIQDLSLFSVSPQPMGVTFYEGSCSCYLSSVGSTLLTS